METTSLPKTFHPLYLSCALVDCNGKEIRNDATNPEISGDYNCRENDIFFCYVF